MREREVTQMDGFTYIKGCNYILYACCYIIKNSIDPTFNPYKCVIKLQKKIHIYSRIHSIVDEYLKKEINNFSTKKKKRERN